MKNVILATTRSCSTRVLFMLSRYLLIRMRLTECVLCLLYRIVGSTAVHGKVQSTSKRDSPEVVHKHVRSQVYWKYTSNT